MVATPPPKRRLVAFENCISWRRQRDEVNERSSGKEDQQEEAEDPVCERLERHTLEFPVSSEFGSGRL